MAIPSTPLRPFVVTFVFLSLSLFVSSICICHPKDKKILLQIQESLGNPDELVRAWQLNTDCCTGSGIECNSDGRVTYFCASDSNNKFEIPSSIGDLDYLESMRFFDLPNLIGTIPPTITKLKYLNSIEISNTRLSGDVPQFLGQIPTLQSIILGSNNLSGSIPPSLGKLHYLSELNLYGNHLHGPIPDIFSSLDRSFNVQNPLTIILSDNKLSGKLPRSMGNISIQWIEVARNNLIGDALFLFGQEKTSLWYCSLYGNRFSFDFSNITVPSIMEDLYISENRIYGSIPESLGYESWYEFNVSWNQLCGPIPQSLNLQIDDPTAFFHNKCLCGYPLSPCQ